MTAISQTVLTKLMLARHLFHLADREVRSQQDIALFAAANLMQDALEAFLLALSEHLNASIEARTEFAAYLDKIDEKLRVSNFTIKDLPFRVQLLALNRIRVLAKHQGIQPDRKTMLQRALDCREFFTLTAQEVLQRPFWSLSLLDLLDPGEVKDALVAARAAFDRDDFRSCLEECRKVTYLEVEMEYNVAPYEKDDAPTVGLASLLFHHCKSHYWTKNKDWIKKNVKEPCDYIQLDHSEVDRDLLKDGIDTSIFWNIWRLTPAVYRTEKDSEWIIRYEPVKVEGPDVRDSAEYVLEHSVEFALLRQERRRAIRKRGYERRYVVLRREGVQFFSRALRTSEIEGTLPAGATRIDVAYRTLAIDGNGYFWRAFYTDGDFSTYLSGFVDEAEIDWEAK